MIEIEQETGESPAALKAKPELFPDSQEFWDAFWCLSASRPNNGFGVAAIPLTEVVAFLSLFPTEDKDIFCRLIRVMDSAFMGHYGDKKTN